MLPPDTASAVDPGISRVGLGTWALGGVGWGPQDDRDSVATILRAVDSGVDWVDTAAVYGGGHAERVVGDALSQLHERERPQVFTKGGMRIDGSSGNTYRDLSPASLRSELEGSLTRLRLERVDLYQLHWPVAEQSVVEAAWETLGELQAEGKIRRAGVSNFDLAQLRRCGSTRPVDALQLPLSLLQRDGCAELIPWAAASGTWVLAYSPLESGLLSGCFSLARLAGLPAEDWRRRRPQFQVPAIERTLALVERLRGLASELESSLVELAIAWTLAWPGVSGAIVGARTPAQVDDWISAATLRLDAGILRRIAVAIAETQAGSGPSLPCSPK